MGPFAHDGISPHRMYPARRDSPPTTVKTSWVGAMLYDESKVSQSPSNSNRRAKLSQVRYQAVSSTHGNEIVAY